MHTVDWSVISERGVGDSGRNRQERLGAKKDQQHATGSRQQTLGAMTI